MQATGSNTFVDKSCFASITEKPPGGRTSLVRPPTCWLPAWCPRASQRKDRVAGQTASP